MRKWIGLMLFVVMIVLSGCDNKKNGVDKHTLEMDIYYLDSKTSGIVSENYVPVGTTKEELVQELLDALKKEPKNLIYKRALPETVTIKEYSFTDDQLTINFDTSYSDITGIPEVLCRATIVKTLSQIEGVEYIQFNVNGQPLTDSHGTVIQLMTDEDFIENTGDEKNYLVTLYFANATGDGLIEASVNIYNTQTGSIEERVINQLINGPTELNMYDTIPEGTILLNVTLKEGICYVDFNEKFLEAIPDISGEVTVFSIVNSLVELPNINKVQFLINGEIRETFRDNIKLNNVFERNLNILEGSNVRNNQ